MSKISFRFYKDHEVRAGNYWRWLKKKLMSEGIQHVLKLIDPDGKKRKAAVLDAYGVGPLANN